jgi:hypothetical protein
LAAVEDAARRKTHLTINGQLAERALWANVTPSAGSRGYLCFPCDLQATTVDALMKLRWLPAEYADDINEIANAFRRFAGGLSTSRVAAHWSCGTFIEGNRNPPVRRGVS